MSKWVFWLCTLLALVAINACKSADNRPDTVIRNLGVVEVQDMIREQPGITLIDVRTTQEFTGELGHIGGSVLKPVQTIAEWGPALELPREETIILVCRSGNRSGKAAKVLQELGYKDLVNMSGGMLAWNKAGFGVEK